MELLLQIGAGIGLASCAGLRTFLPLFAVGVAGRLHVVELGSRFDWLASTAALVTLGAAVLAEVLADKFPLVDHFLDGAATFVRPFAGALAMASTLRDASPLAAAVLAIILGAPAATGVHLLKSKARLLSTATTLGAANPIHSAVEDAASFTGCVVCLLAPLAALVLVVASLVVLVWRRARRLARLADPGARPSA